jgi:hypothetical protein
MVKLLALSTIRTGSELPDPVICSFAAELSSFGFFQRTVGINGQTDDDDHVDQKG